MHGLVARSREDHADLNVRPVTAASGVDAASVQGGGNPIEAAALAIMISSNFVMRFTRETVVREVMT